MLKNNSLRALQVVLQQENSEQENINALIESISRQYSSSAKKQNSHSQRQFLFSPPKAAIPKPLQEVHLDDENILHQEKENLASQLDHILQLDASFALSSPSKSATFSPRKNIKPSTTTTVLKNSKNANRNNNVNNDMSVSRSSVFSTSSSASGFGRSSKSFNLVKRLQGKGKLLEAEIDVSKKDDVVAQLEKELAERKKRIAKVRLRAEVLKQEKSDADDLVEKKKRFVESHVKQQQQLEQSVTSPCHHNHQVEKKDQSTSPIAQIIISSNQDVQKENSSSSGDVISKSIQKRACLDALYNVNQKRRNIALQDRSNEANRSARKTAELMVKQSQEENSNNKRVLSRLFPF